MTQHLAGSVEIVTEPGAALERALQSAAPEDVIFVTGSLYLVGDLRRYWDTRSADHMHADIAHPARRR
jgi:folylpolyglutamate synthase/dihydropteroate synthase